MRVTAKSTKTGRHRASSRFTLLRHVGDGGMGVVYAAFDTRLRRQVALKFSAPQLSVGASAAQLFHEAEAIARVRSPHICQVHDVDLHRGRPCLVLELLEGTNLQQYLALTTLETSMIISSCLQMAEALEAIHAAGIVHQDIKPANLFVTATGQIKILDFGVAIDLLDPAPCPAIAANARDSLYGTVSYIAPERVLRRPVTPRSDLFSLGAVLYEMLTGLKPFAGATTGDTIMNILDREPLPIRTVAPDRPRALDHIVMKLLAKQPDRRFQSAGALRASLLKLRSLRAVCGRVQIPVLVTEGEPHGTLARRSTAVEQRCA